MIQMPRSSAQRPMASTSSGGYTAPVGLLGDTKSNALVRGVTAASSCSIVTRKPMSAVVGSSTGTPPPNAMHSGYDVQYGAGSNTSSPGSHNTWNVLNTACLPPLVTSTRSAAQSTPESRLVLCAIAARSSGSPAVGE